MPVFEHKAVAESKWMWRRCSIVRKAAGRYCKLLEYKFDKKQSSFEFSVEKVF